MRSVLLGPRLLAKACEVKEIANDQNDHARYCARNACSSSYEQSAVDAAVMDDNLCLSRILSNFQGP